MGNKKKWAAPTTTHTLGGRWVLDRAASDSPGNHLRALGGVSDLAVSAAEKLDFVISQHVTSKVFWYRQESHLGERERVLSFGETKREVIKDSEVLLTLSSVSPTTCVITSRWAGRGTIRDTRTLEGGSGGSRLHQEIVFEHLSGETTTGHRYFSRLRVTRPSPSDAAASSS